MQEAQETKDCPAATNAYRVSWKQGLHVDHLSKDAAQRPDINWSGVMLGPQQYFRSSVPQCHHLHYSHSPFYGGVRSSCAVKRSNNVGNTSDDDSIQYLMRVCPDRNSESTCQTKVC